MFGTLDGSGQTLSVGSTGVANTVDIDGTVQNATIALAGGSVSFGQSALASFNAVTWTGGALDLGTGSAELLVTNGLTVQGANNAPGTINLDGSFSNLGVEDAETLSAVTINIGSATGDDALSADGSLTLANTTTVNLLAGADFAELTGTGTLVNDGTINAAATDGIISPGEFTNAGMLIIDAGATLAVQPGDVFTNSGTVTVDAGATLDIQFLNGFANTGAVNDLGGAISIGAAVSGGGLDQPVRQQRGRTSGGGHWRLGELRHRRRQIGSGYDQFRRHAAGVCNCRRAGLDVGGLYRRRDCRRVRHHADPDRRGTTETFALSTAPGDSSQFYVYADSNGGTEISSVPCYCPGTRIATVNGEVPIEHLVIGDLVVTAAGQARPIRWIGRRSYVGRFLARNPNVLPVLIRADALGDDVPQRDLLVSPLHAMFIDGLLIPAGALVNDHSIVVLQGIERVDYIHLELDSHDVILAEGAPAESFIDDESRGMFHNAADYHRLHPDAVSGAPHYCAPRVEDGEAVEAVRRRIAARSAPARLGQPLAA